MPQNMFFSLPKRERDRSRADLELLARLGTKDHVAFVVERADGTRGEGSLPPSLIDLIRSAVEKLMGGHRVTVAEDDAELTPEEAAEILGYSRPLVVRRMDAGALPFRYVGSHRRTRLRDVLDLRERERASREAQAELAEVTEELITKHDL
jgi:excisionase family DNA binding protein